MYILNLLPDLTYPVPNFISIGYLLIRLHLHISLTAQCPPVPYVITSTSPVLYMAARDASDTALVDREHQVSADKDTAAAPAEATNADGRLDAPQTAYLFEPSDVADEPPRPAKRRRVSQKHASADAITTTAARYFQPLLGGAESDECARLRQQLFHETWSRIDSRIQVGDPVPSNCLPWSLSALLSLPNSSIQSVCSGRPTNPPSGK